MSYIVDVTIILQLVWNMIPVTGKGSFELVQLDREISTTRCPDRTLARQIARALIQRLRCLPELCPTVALIAALYTSKCVSLVCTERRASSRGVGRCEERAGDQGIGEHTGCGILCTGCIGEDGPTGG